MALKGADPLSCKYVSVDHSPWWKSNSWLLIRPPCFHHFRWPKFNFSAKENCQPCWLKSPIIIWHVSNFPFHRGCMESTCFHWRWNVHYKVADWIQNGRTHTIWLFLVLLSTEQHEMFQFISVWWHGKVPDWLSWVATAQGKTGNLLITFSRQRKHREFRYNTGKIWTTQGILQISLKMK